MIKLNIYTSLVRVNSYVNKFNLNYLLELPLPLAKAGGFTANHDNLTQNVCSSMD